MDKKTAGLLMSAIISDTLLFRSPTCTPVDEKAARALAKIAGIDIESYAMEMFAAGSNLKKKTDKEIFYQDYKIFTAGNIRFGVSQVTSLNEEELENLRPRLLHFAKGALETENLNMVFVMLTNILKQDSTVLAVGARSGELMKMAFSPEAEKVVFEINGENTEGYAARIPEMVSRKKQLIPPLSLFAEQL